jgi:hypothetical protein
MGLLDDAIREHLDLKRRRGADPSEIDRAEREALGPVRRAPEELEVPDYAPEAEPERAEEYEYEFEAEDEPYSDEVEPLEAPPEADFAPAPPVADPGPHVPDQRFREPGPTDYDREPSDYESEPGPYESEPPPHQPPAHEPAHDPAGRELLEHDEPSADEPPRPLARPAPPPHPAPESPPIERGRPSDETVEYQIEEHPEGEDVLEETPDFLQDTPEHDRLWFEQRPPKDFDFDG